MKIYINRNIEPFNLCLFPLNSFVLRKLFIVMGKLFKMYIENGIFGLRAQILRLEVGMYGIGGLLSRPGAINFILKGSIIFI